MKSFVDLVKIRVKGGNGGDGRVVFRREKFVPRGGPSGGDGGRGGDIYLIADKALVTLYDFTHQREFKAQDGRRGGPKEMTGKSGDDLYRKVPAGTVVKTFFTSLADLTEPGQKVLVAQGGKGGLGNAHFKSATNQAPREYTQGGQGEEKELVLELKLIADVGLIGLPNAGKSTLLNALTAAQAKVGEYPFTTLHPNLAVAIINRQQVVLADIPGLIEGASKGKGLGDEFLRHIERTKILVHLIDPMIGLEGQQLTNSLLVHQAVKNYQVIRQELADYSSSLLQKPEIVVVSKIDITEIRSALSQIQKKLLDPKGLGRSPVRPVLATSAVSGQGLTELKKELARVLL